MICFQNELNFENGDFNLYCGIDNNNIESIYTCAAVIATDCPSGDQDIRRNIVLSIL
jgi:hypothetical protein